MRWQNEGETELMHVINENVMREMKSDSRGDVGMCRGDNIERIFRCISETLLLRKRLIV